MNVTSAVVDIRLDFLTDDSSLVVVDEATVGSSVKSPMSVVPDDSVIANGITYYL